MTHKLGMQLRALPLASVNQDLTSESTVKEQVMNANMWSRRYWIASDVLDAEVYESILTKAGFTLLNQGHSRFAPHGWSRFYLLAESHLAVHSFPEAGQDYVELASCNKALLLRFHALLHGICREHHCHVQDVLTVPLANPDFIHEDNHVVLESYPGGAWVCPYDSIVVRKTTPYQEFAILIGPVGRSLWIDGYLQSKERTEHIYHEMLVHPAMLGGPGCRNVLVLGGGEGAILREVLRYDAVERVTMVDIDGELVAACKQHLPTWHQGAFDNPRVDLQIMDAFRFLRTRPSPFDLIILDLPAVGSQRNRNLEDISRQYVQETFYADLRRALAPGGVVCSYLGSIFDDTEPHAGIRAAATAVFPHLWLYRVNGLLLKMLVMSERDIALYNVNRPTEGSLGDIASAVDEGLQARTSGGLRHYNGLEHIASFALSNDMLEWLQ